MKTIFSFLAAMICFTLFTALSAPDEGMWLLTQLDRLPWADMQKHGLELTAKQIFDPADSSSLVRTIVLLPGGTGSFVSSSGLIITNHHIAFAGIQTVSSVQDDYLKNGFYAKANADELSLPSYTAEFVVDITDITKDILATVSDTMSPASRADAIRKKSREVEKSYKDKGDADADYKVNDAYNGVQFYLSHFTMVRDIRLVYAPPISIGNYGGEVDNWIWPRHTGDFAFLRAYVAPDGKHGAYAKENIPYHPNAFLPVSNKQRKEESFAMVMGFPGRTFRYRTATEIRLAQDENLPLQMKLFKKRMDIIEAAGKADRQIELKYATVWRRLANTYKNSEGSLEGMKRSKIIGERDAREKAFKEFLRTKPELETNYGTILGDIGTVYDNFKTFNRKQIVLSQIFGGSDILSLASAFKELAKSFAKDSTGHEKADDTKIADLNKSIPTTFKDNALSVDKEELTAMMLEAGDLPKPQRISAVDKIVGDKTGSDREKAVREFVDDLYKHSKLTTSEGATKLLAKSADDIRDDDFVKFAIALDKDNVGLQSTVADFNSKINDLRRKLMEAWIAWKGSEIYPDANRTLRLTYGKVEPYSPHDAVSYGYITKLAGVMEKETGEDPFIVPSKLRDLWEKKDFGPYADPDLGDVPVAFLSDNDITGGNSGSPVINGRGELIGVAFDGNWEGVVGDYFFQEPLNRTISVDSRYVLFLLDKYSNAQNILSELMVK